LQGVRDQRKFRLVMKTLDAFHHVDLVGDGLAARASENHRVLRDRGITIRKTIGTLIATYCIENGFALLHADRDFEPFASHLGLQLVYSDA
jgi:predicted nucleic acid-binding protein